MDDATSELPTFDDNDENFYEKQVLKLTTLASLSSIIANILISVTIVKYKNLRQDTTYVIILQVVIVQIVSLVLDEVLLWFFTYFGTPLPQYHGEFCAIFVGVRMLNAVSFLTLGLLLLHWYAKLHCAEARYTRFVRAWKYAQAVIYAVCLLWLPFLTELCLQRDVFATFYVVFSFQVVMIALAVCMNAVEWWRGRCEVRNVGLGVANIVVVFCTPAYVCLVLAYFNVFPVYVVLFADVLATGVFPFVFFYLYKFDNNFRMYFRKMVAWRGRNDEPISYNLIYNSR